MIADRRRAWDLLAVALAMALAACQPPGQRRYPLAGVVQEARLSERELTVAHEDIPGFMPGMTMTFRLPGQDWPGAKPGDRIEATLVVTDKETWIEDVRVTARGLPVADRPPTRPGAAPGDLVPEFELVNQDARPIRLSDYRGRSLLLTFIYTRCPLPEFCPLLMKNFRKVDEALARDPDLFQKTRLLSISFDVAHDTPEVLNAFGRAFVEDRGLGRFGHWELASGSAEQVRGIAGFFGLVYEGDGEEFSHSMCTAVIAPDGKLARVYRDNTWTPEEIVADMRVAAMGTSGPSDRRGP
jgi:protein SCO1/2